MGGRRGREIELKLEARPQDAARLSRLKSLPDARLGRSRAEQVYSIYFDTANHALRHAGLTLRVRHAGSRRLQTVKTEARGNGLAIDRGEDEVTLRGPGPDLAQVQDAALRARAQTAVAEAPLLPLFETVMLRASRLVKTAEGATVEFVIDQGTLKADGAMRSLCEVELELHEGEPAALYDLARALNDRAPLRLLQRSKADRGFELLGEKPAGPQKSRSVTLPKRATVAEALQIILLSCLAQLVANEPCVVEQRAVEGVHQMRVALRRLRAALGTFAPLVDGEALDRVESEARALGATLGAARDLDVFTTDIMPRAAGALGDKNVSLVPLKEAAEAARREAWDRLVEALVARQYTDLILDLAATAMLRRWTPAEGQRKRALEGPARRFAAERLDDHLKKAAKLARALARLSEEERHTLRKRLKRLRYAGEFFESLFDAEKTRRYTKRLGALQDAFGALNDVATATRLVDTLAAANPERREEIEQAGALIIAWHQEAADALLAEAGQRWAKLARIGPFWRAA